MNPNKPIAVNPLVFVWCLNVDLPFCDTELFTVKQAFSDPANRLELNWRPQDVYSKSAYGDHIKVTRLLLKVKRKRKPCPVVGDNDGQSEQEEVQHEYSGQVLGTIDTSYKFQSKAHSQSLLPRYIDLYIYIYIFESISQE